MLNTYTLEVHKKQGKPVFVVNIEHIMLAGTYFFKTLTEAQEFIKTAKERLKQWAELEYNPYGEMTEGYKNILDAVLLDDDICIGVDGHTYSKELREKMKYEIRN